MPSVDVPNRVSQSALLVASRLVEFSSAKRIIQRKNPASTRLGFFIAKIFTGQNNAKRNNEIF